MNANQVISNYIMFRNFQNDVSSDFLSTTLINKNAYGYVNISQRHFFPETPVFDFPVEETTTVQLRHSSQLSETSLFIYHHKYLRWTMV